MKLFNLLVIILIISCSSVNNYKVKDNWQISISTDSYGFMYDVINSSSNSFSFAYLTYNENFENFFTLNLDKIDRNGKVVFHKKIIDTLDSSSNPIVLKQTNNKNFIIGTSIRIFDANSQNALNNIFL